MSVPVWCAACARGVRIAVQVQPGAKKTEAVGLHGDALKLKLQAPPIEGRANEALVRYLADTLGVPRSAVEITHGHTNRRKLVEVEAEGLSPEAVAALLLGHPRAGGDP
ncbi:MAG: DUF167 domain-containing protein [Telluria sp.]